MLGNETKKIYGDYILLDSNKDSITNINNDFKYSPFYEQEFFIINNKKQFIKVLDENNPDNRHAPYVKRYNSTQT